MILRLFIFHPMQAMVVIEAWMISRLVRAQGGEGGIIDLHVALNSTSLSVMELVKLCNVMCPGGGSGTSWRKALVAAK